MYQIKTFLISMLLGWFAANSLAQIPFPPGDTTNQLSVSLWLPHTTNLHAPATIDIQAYINLRDPEPKVGDFVSVEFFANSNSLGIARAVWHGEIRPHVPPGSAVPMFI